QTRNQSGLRQISHSSSSPQAARAAQALPPCAPPGNTPPFRHPQNPYETDRTQSTARPSTQTRPALQKPSRTFGAATSLEPAATDSSTCRSRSTPCVIVFSLPRQASTAISTRSIEQKCLRQHPF